MEPVRLAAGSRSTVSSQSDVVATSVVAIDCPRVRFSALRAPGDRAPAGIFGQTGAIERIVMPDAGGTTMGLAFIEFASAEEAAKAIRLTDGYALDKSHVFKVAAYAEMKRLAELSETRAAASLSARVA